MVVQYLASVNKIYYIIFKLFDNHETLTCCVDIYIIMDLSFNIRLVFAWIHGNVLLPTDCEMQPEIQEAGGNGCYKLHSKEKFHNSCITF